MVVRMARKIGRMSRWNPSRLLELTAPKLGAPAGDPAAFGTASFDRAQIAEEIGMAALDMAQRAQAAGLPTLGFLLETVALEASAQADAAKWPSDAPEH